MRKLNVLLGLYFVLLCIALTGCGKDENSRYKEAESDTLFVLSDSSLVCTVIDLLDQNYYDAEELKAFVEDELRRYNTDGENITLIDLSKNDDSVKLILKYSSPGHYADFNSEELFIGTVAEAFNAGYGFEGDFYRYDNLSAVKASDVVYNADSNVIIMEPASDIIINVAGTIKFIGKSVKEMNKTTAQIPANCRSYIIYE